ncbi:MAG: glycoside hydrolase family 2 TIM barrel-domain containing protein [Opitutales bacterium]
MKKNTLRSLYGIGLLICCFAAVISATAQESKRLVNWKFIQADADASASTATWEPVTVPHSWNVEDGKGGGRYYRGPGWYQHALTVVNHTPGERYFVHFQAVGTVAEVYVDGHPVGEHKGGYSAFTVELTDHVKGNGTYDLRVRANNAFRADVPPLSGDFTVAGGMHRPAELLIENAVCISPRDYGSPGVRLFQENVSKERADLRVQILADNGSENDQTVNAVVTLTDAQGRTVASRNVSASVKAKRSAALESVLTVSNPHLWHGVKDPYLYSLTVELFDGGTRVDSYTKAVGFRFYRIDPEKGFFLNGESYPLRGVNLHYDHEALGSALTDEQVREDYAYVMEVGANTVRLAHYPHARLSHELCDRLGLLVWAEIPLVNEIRATPEFAANTEAQLVEMIRQHGNHCSIFCWGITNEMFQRTTDSPFDLLQALQERAEKEDPTRFTVLATNRNRQDLISITDHFAINNYPGWYGGSPKGLNGALKSYNVRNGNPGVGVSEYGAGGSIYHHDQSLEKVPPKGKWHPEQWQAYLHENHYRSISKFDPCWGSYVWLMFDFASARRDEGDRPGVNDKGLMTHDRQVRKDAFFFYKANWNPEPMLHLTSKRHTVRRQALTPVKAYSNAAEVELWVNGESLGTQAPDALSIIQWDAVSLREGSNEIVVRSGDLVDRAEWTLDPDAPNPKILATEIIEGRSRANHAQKGQGPSLAFDGDRNTRWASDIKEPYLIHELEEAQLLSGISILWFKGHERAYKFELATSMDGNTWRPVYEGTSGKSRFAEFYRFPQPEDAKHIRITCYGSDVNQWSCIYEAQAVLQSETELVENL